MRLVFSAVFMQSLCLSCQFVLMDLHLAEVGMAGPLEVCWNGLSRWSARSLGLGQSEAASAPAWIPSVVEQVGML